MSSHVPSQDTFDRVLSFLMFHFGGSQPKQGFRPFGDVQLFMEQLLNLCESSVHYQYHTSRGDETPYPPSMEIFKDWKPKEYLVSELVAFEIVQLLDCINYQIEYYKEPKDGIYIEAYINLQKARYQVLSIAVDLENIKAYKDAPWGS